MNGDPLNPWEDQDRLGPAGDLNPETPNLTGMINTVGLDIDGSGFGDAFPGERQAEREAEDAEQTAAGGVGDTGPEPVPDPDELEADNEVERDSIESVEPGDAPD
ncbi:hypothetical protein GCM10009819_28540 [Agromyces tropicus]|uniref:Uncharacterized protein n=1 Tax=Agromyces tropicus TaxID=555371 RepID=A0ABN2UP43_9MICO